MTTSDRATPRRRTRPRLRSDVVTIEQVARKADVSVATVSRALRGLPNVAPSTRERVEAVAAELNYQVDTYASRLATGRNDTVGLAVPHIDNWFFSQVAAGVETVLADAGLDVLLYSVGDEGGRNRLLSDPSAIRRRLDGLVLIDVLLRAEEITVLADEHANVVTVGQRTEAFPSVTVDDRAAAADITRHLVELGHRRIGLIGASDDSVMRFEVPSERVSGFADVLASAGIRRDPTIEDVGNFSVKGGGEAMARLLAHPEPPTAIIALSDEMAMGAIGALRERGLDAPRDLSIVGFDDHDLASVFQLTTMRQEPQWQGASAGRLLLGIGDDPGPETRHVVGSTRLVVRATTGPPRSHRLDG